MLLKEKFHLKDTDAGQYSPLVLAYLGDAAYEILIRTIVVSEGNMQVNKLRPYRGGACGLQTGKKREVFLYGQECNDEGLPDGDRL